MAKTRVDFQNFLEDLSGDRNVYYQPPSNLRMNYPATRYKLADIVNIHADNLVYNQKTAYQVTRITEDPDDPVVKKLSELPFSDFDRSYVADNLNHFVFTIFF